MKEFQWCFVDLRDHREGSLDHLVATIVGKLGLIQFAIFPVSEERTLERGKAAEPNVASRHDTVLPSALLNLASLGGTVVDPEVFLEPKQYSTHELDVWELP